MEPTPKTLNNGTILAQKNESFGDFYLRKSQWGQWFLALQQNIQKPLPIC